MGMEDEVQVGADYTGILAVTDPQAEDPGKVEEGNQVGDNQAVDTFVVDTDQDSHEVVAFGVDLQDNVVCYVVGLEVVSYAAGLEVVSYAAGLEVVSYAVVPAVCECLDTMKEQSAWDLEVVQQKKIHREEDHWEMVSMRLLAQNQILSLHKELVQALQSYLLFLLALPSAPL